MSNDGRREILPTAFKVVVDKKRRMIRFEFSQPITWMEFNLQASTSLRDVLVARVDELRALV